MLALTAHGVEGGQVSGDPCGVGGERRLARLALELIDRLLARGQKASSSSLRLNGR
jgi:hypothetical protein